MMAKLNVSARLEPEMYEKLKALADSTGKNLSDLVVEALAEYLDMPVATVSDRLLVLEQQMAEVMTLFGRVGKTRRI